jgi:hypothetical protein
MLKKAILPLVLCTTLLGGVVSTGVADAAVPTAVTAKTQAGNLRQWLTAHRRQVRRAVVSVSAKAIGISRQDLVSGLRTGRSISDVATEHKVSTPRVVAALEKAADAEVARAVARHELTTTEAGTLKTELPAVVAKLVNRQFGHR